MVWHPWYGVSLVASAARHAHSILDLGAVATVRLRKFDLSREDLSPSLILSHLVVQLQVDSLHVALLHERDNPQLALTLRTPSSSLYSIET
jgi:hypothetical protein